MGFWGRNTSAFTTTFFFPCKLRKNYGEALNRSTVARFDAFKSKKKRKPSTLDVTCNRLVETHRNTPLHSTPPHTHKHIKKARNRNTDNDRLQVPTTKALFFLLRRLPLFVLFNQNVPPLSVNTPAGRWSIWPKQT